MGFFDNLRKQAASQFVEILEWLDDSSDSLVHRLPVYDQQIKMGAKLIVRENQQALFINEGRAADLFRPGTHTVSTRNVPVLAALKGWKYGFRSPFKAEVYFFNTRLFPDLKWGTSQPVMMRDAEFGMIRLRAHGTFALRVADAKKLFSEIVGTRGLTTTEEITGQLRSIIVTRFSDTVAESKIPALDLAAHLDELSELGAKAIGPQAASFGLELSRFFVESLSLPEEVQGAIDQRTRLGVMGDRIPQFARMQAAEAITIAAGASGGAAGAGVGLGAGMAIGQTMAGAMPPLMEPAGPSPVAPPRWTINIEGRNFGPYSEQALGEMIRTGQADPATLAWRPGASAWAPLSSYDELKVWMPEAPPARPEVPEK
ncbi:MAG TPA: SPFH domain-containing protein [Candidatus Polarisedimenticolia bacterium]